jgi:hypothetical protein
LLILVAARPVHHAIELSVVDRIGAPSRLFQSNGVLKQDSRPVGLPDALRLPERLVMSSHASFEDGTRGVEKHSSPEFLFRKDWEVPFEINSSTGPESLVPHLNHPVYELTFTRVFGGTAADLDRQVDQEAELGVVQWNELFTADDSASHCLLTSDQ